MASADRTYVDPSALRSLYVHDDRSRRFCTWRRRAGGALRITRFGRAELMNAIALAAHRRDIAPEDARAACADVEADLGEGRLVLTDLSWRLALDLTVELTQRHTTKLGTRTLDVLHVASAAALEMKRLVTYDARQAALAAAVGLRVLMP